MRDRSRADLELAAIIVARRARLRRVQTHHRAKVVVAAVLVLLAALLVGSAATGRAVLLDSCSLDALKPLALGQNSFVYSSNGTELYHYTVTGANSPVVTTTGGNSMNTGFEPFARIGLLFTKNLDLIREAYKSAGVAEGLWEAA